MDEAQLLTPQVWGDIEDAMTSGAVLGLLQRYASSAAKHANGNIVEIGAYRGASTIALAKGLQAMGRGKLTSIDPHQSNTGVYGGRFLPVDHEKYLENLQRAGIATWVEHLCTTSEAVARNWQRPIDLLWIDGDHRYGGVTRDITEWLPWLVDDGIVIFDDVFPGSDVENAIRDHLPFSRYRLVERMGPILVLKKQAAPRTLYLCGGMQSSGSTLVSWCFLQRSDLDGIYDMENARIQQDFSRVATDSVWLKMTIGAFRLVELVDLYQAQGWIVKPILVQRDLTEVYRSLAKKQYGVDGCTGDDPPLHTRIHRYLADLETARSKGWPILRYEALIDNPGDELRRVCDQIGLTWEEAMLSWPKPETSIADPSNGNSSFQDSKLGVEGMLATLANYRRIAETPSTEYMRDFLGRMIGKLKYDGDDAVHALILEPENSETLLSPVKYEGTRRQYLEQEISKLQQVAQAHQRILNHFLFGRLLRLWKRRVNQSFPARED